MVRVHRAARIGFAALAFLVLVTSGYAWATYQNFAASVPHGVAVPALAAGQKAIDGAAQNILLIGDDTRAGASVIADQQDVLCRPVDVLLARGQGRHRDSVGHARGEVLVGGPCVPAGDEDEEGERCEADARGAVNTNHDLARLTATTGDSWRLHRRAAVGLRKSIVTHGLQLAF